MATSDELRREIAKAREQRQRDAVRRDRLDRLQQRPSRLAGVDDAGRPLVRSLGGNALPIGAVGNVQGELGQQGRSDGRGFAVGSVSRKGDRKKNRPEKIAQVFFRVDGANLAAYIVTDRRVQQIDQVPYAEYTLAKAWLIIDDDGKTDITIVYRNSLAGSNLKFLWIDTNGARRTATKTDAIAQLEYYPLGGGQYKAGQPAQFMGIRKIKRTTLTYPQSGGPYRRVRFQPWVPTVPLAAPADAFSVDPAAATTPNTPAVNFSIAGETGIDVPAPGVENETLGTFSTTFSGSSQCWFGWLTDTGLDQVATQFNFAGTYPGREFEDRPPLFPSTEQIPGRLQTKIEFTAGAIANYKIHPAVAGATTSQFTLIPDSDAAIGIIDTQPGGLGATCAAINLPVVDRSVDAAPRKNFLGRFRGASGYNAGTSQYEFIYDLLFCSVDDAGVLTTQTIQNPPFSLQNRNPAFYKDRKFYYYHPNGTYDPPVPGTLTTERIVAIALDGTTTETTRNFTLPTLVDQSFLSGSIGGSNLVAIAPKLR